MKTILMLLTLATAPSFANPFTTLEITPTQTPTVAPSTQIIQIELRKTRMERDVPRESRASRSRRVMILARKTRMARDVRLVREIREMQLFATAIVL